MSQILHVVVVGFHHKRGCQIEFSYPPLSNRFDEVPEEWSNLPSLAMPDGAHNTDSDVIYFLLPSHDEPGKSIYGISCYRQISATELVAKTDDVTRSTVQKSVCVLSRVPLFGVLKAKLQLITQAYFNEKDFAKVEVLSQMYNNLCEMFEGDMVDGQAACMDISVRELVKKFKHRTLLLFKLLLLEKKVVFNIFPVQTLGDTLIALLSLYPRMLEEGLFYASTAKLDPNDNIETAREVVGGDETLIGSSNESQERTDDSRIKERDEKEPSEIKGVDVSVSDCEEIIIPPTYSIKDDQLANVKDGFGMPISLFVKDNLFHPYLSISYLDMIRSRSVRAYTIGATNQLFVQRKELVDAIVTLDDFGDGSVEITNLDLKRQLTLTTADLRFGDYLIKNVEMNDKVEAAWEGGDEWIRLQFRAYLLALASSSKSDLQPAIADHGLAFVTAWRHTRNYNLWMIGKHDDLASVPPGHAFSGQMGVRDVALMVEHVVAGSEGAKKALSALSNTGKNLGETGNRVKQSFSSWFGRAAIAVGQAASNVQTVNSQGVTPVDDNEREIENALEAKE